MKICPDSVAETQGNVSGVFTNGIWRYRNVVDDWRHLDDGNAELELVDSLDPFSEGIIFSVMLPKKSWKNISNLSGGE
jgi:hypothetical protein